MGEIFLVRHAQASFRSSHYDQLSELGMKQAEITAQHIVNHTSPSLAVSGTMQRHQQTAAPLTHHTNNLTLLIDEGFNEFNHEDVIACINKDWRDKNVFQHYLKTQENPSRTFDEIFKQAVKRWISGNFDDEYRESWPQFKKRVTHAFLNLRDNLEKSQTAYVFTSGGPIAVICQSILELTDNQCFNLNATIANASLTRLLYTSDKTSLSYFNNFFHLETLNKDLLTFR